MPTAVLESKVRQDIEAFLSRHGRVKRDLAKPSAQGVRDFIRVLSELISKLNTSAHVSDQDALVIRNSVIHQAFLPLLCFRMGRTEDTARLLAASWLVHSPTASEKPISIRVRPVALDRSEARRLLEIFNVAITEALVQSTHDLRGRHTIRRLMTSLRLSYDDTGRTLGVSGETARRWANGTVQIPEDKMAILDTFGSALGLLLQLFLPDRLPEVIRREAETFGGRRALDWILEGRLKEAAETYDRLLLYQT